MALRRRSASASSCSHRFSVARRRSVFDSRALRAVAGGPAWAAADGTGVPRAALTSEERARAGAVCGSPLCISARGTDTGVIGGGRRGAGGASQLEVASSPGKSMFASLRAQGARTGTWSGNGDGRHSAHAVQVATARLTASLLARTERRPAPPPPPAVPWPSPRQPPEVPWPGSRPPPERRPPLLRRLVLPWWRQPLPPRGS